MTEEVQNPAKVILSFDFEIGWGDVIYGDVWRRREANHVYRRLRVVLPELLREMDDLEIPASWATVGAMFDEPKDRTLDHLPTEASCLVQMALKTALPESFNGRDLFEMVLSARARHDIVCHSYSHIPFTYPEVDRAFVQADLRAFYRALDTYNLSTDRLVFPENLENFHDAIAAEGYRVIRVAADTFFRNRLLYLASIALIPPPLARDAAGKSGLVNHHGSMLFNDAGQAWRVPLLTHRLRLGLQNARRHGGTLHVWSHPFNFAESNRLKEGFIRSLRLIARERDRGNLSVVTM